MKKAILIGFAATVLTGCSFIQNLTTSKADEMIETVESEYLDHKDEANDLFAEADPYRDKSNTFKNTPTMYEAKKTLDLVNDASSKLDKYQDLLKDHLELMEEMEKKVAEINDDEQQNLADQFIDALMNQIETEEEYLDIVSEMHDLNEVYYGAWVSGNKPQPDNYNTVNKQRAEKWEELMEISEETGDAWEEFYEEVTGKKYHSGNSADKDSLDKEKLDVEYPENLSSA